MRHALEAEVSMDEFWERTPYELGMLIEAYANRQRSMLEVVAWHACNVMNVHLRKGQRMTVRKLLPPRKGVVDVSNFASVEELNAELAKIRAQK